MLRALASKLPTRAQQELKRLRCGYQIRHGLFTTPEPEYSRVAEWVGSGDWTIDVGANIGHYTCALAAACGTTGRVIAFEPIAQTFELLASNVALLPYCNVTLINAAASDATRIVQMTLPFFDSGLTNFYMATINDDATAVGSYNVATLSIDALNLPVVPTLIKIDAEGHELQVIRGMFGLLRRGVKRLIIEGADPQVEFELTSLGYIHRSLPNSPNRIFELVECASAQNQQ